MNGNNVRKRKRPITSCGECYRRKQKCDRECPCAICIIRGVPEKCSFGGEPSLGSDTSNPPPERIVHTMTESASANTISGDDQLVPPTEFDQQIGYTLVSGSNFGILQKSLQREENESSPSKPRLPDFVLYQISEIEQLLAPRAVQVELVDVYFDQCFWWFSGLEPVTFRQTLEVWHDIKSSSRRHFEPIEHQYFSALLFQTLAVALQYLPTKAIDIWEKLNLSSKKSADLLSVKYSKAGMQIMDLLGRHNSTVTAVQHDAMRGIWLKNFSRGTESWYSLGQAIRQAQEQGLHLDHEPSPSLEGNSLNEWLWQDVLRKRLWACLFSWDAHVSFTLGRPRIINANDCTRMDLVACDIPLDTASKAPPTSSLELSKPALITPALFHYAMAYLIHEMLDHSADKANLADQSRLERLHREMDTLLDEISVHFSRTNPDTSWDSSLPSIPVMRLHLYSIANTYLIALHRAHVLRRRESCEAAVGAAMNTLNAQEDLFKITDKEKWRIYTYSFYTIDASIFLAALLLEQPDTLDQSWYDRISRVLQQSLDRLEMMQDASPMAKTGAQILRKCNARIHATLGSSVQTIPSPPDTEPSDHDVSPSLRSWIEQMDQVMLPILEADPGGPFDNALWEVLLTG